MACGHGSGRNASLVEAAFQLAAQEGLGMLTSRGLAEKAGVSLPTIHNSFGSMAVVRQEVTKRLRAYFRDWHDLHTKTSGSLSRVTPEGTVLSAVNELVGAHRGAALLWDEILATGEFPELIAEEHRFSDFWHAHFSRLGCPGDVATLWIDFTYGLVPLALLEQASIGLQSWLPMLVSRFSQRLNRGPTFTESEFPFPPASRPMAPPESEAARRLLEATIRLIAEHGVERLTLRNVAAGAGLSIGSPTYFFSTRCDLIIAAIYELLRRTSARIQEPSHQASAAGNVLDEAGALRIEVKAVLALFGPVARDSSLHPGAAALRDFRGPVARELLRHNGLAVDAVDGIIASTAFEGFLRSSRRPQSNMARSIEERAELHRNLLFNHLSVASHDHDQNDERPLTSP